MRWGMVINLKRCVGCQTCEVACEFENAVPPGIYQNKTLDYETGNYPDVDRAFLPVLCMQCETPPCIDACPSNATQQTDSGIVWTDYDKCEGCKSCMAACPYGAREFFDGNVDYYGGKGDTPIERRIKREHPEDVVIKCDFCRDRVEKGAEGGLTPGEDPEATPVCVISCPTEARVFGDLDDPNSEVSKTIREKDGFQLHPHHGTDPSVYYVR